MNRDRAAPRARSRRSATLPLLALGLLLALGGSARADVVHLRTGENIKGRPLVARSDQKSLVMEDYLSGAVRTLSWEVVEGPDMDRLWLEWGWKNKALKAVPGVRLVQELADGSSNDVRGILVGEDDTYYHVQLGGKVVKVRKDQVNEKIDEEMDPRDIWSPEQLVERFKEELGKREGVDLENPDTRTCWQIAEYAETAEEYETARTYYEKCAADDGFENQGIAKQRLENVLEILRNAAALQAIRAMRMALSIKSFARVREGMEKFATDFPEAGEQVKRRFEDLKNDYEKRRDEFLQLEAKINYPKVVLDLIKDKVAEKDIGLSDATAWTRRELLDASFAALATRLQKRDESVDAAQAQAFWTSRPKSGWKYANYGAGTFIVEPPKIKPPKRSPPKKKPNSKGGAAAPVKNPKPPTRDQWWAKADVKERQQWVMAFYVENSGLFEVGEPKYTQCPLCNGKGIIEKATQTGEANAYLCNRCGGAQNDKRVKFR